MIVFKPKLTSLINGTGRMGSKLMEKTFTLNTALSLWWVQCGEKIAGSILSEVYSPKVTMPHMITYISPSSETIVLLLESRFDIRADIQNPRVPRTILCWLGNIVR